MSYEEIKLDYVKAEDMIKAFQAGQQDLQTAQTNMSKVAQQLEDGALLGKGGEEFKNAINGPLVGSIKKLEEKFQEMAEDVQKAIDFMKQADQKAKSKF